ncbi:GIY-YIG nuclease family protein [Pseudophaeobacter sp.]|uniref:GIY-YIG nuclease family protein n=1 Tax=Pseudophaeobacter sp. TaxID=1971739 RepID=UPI003A974DF2
MAEGFIYILFNRAFQKDQYKIGMTTRTPEDRARDISRGTGVPFAFEVLYEQRVTDCHAAERLLHKKLEKCRTAGNREFFHLPLKEAVKALEEVADKVGRAAVGRQERDAMPIREAHATEELGELTAVAEPRVRRSARQEREGKIATFEDHLAYTDEERREVLVELRRRVHDLDRHLQENERCTSGQRLAYKLPGGVNFLEIKVQKHAVLLHLVDGGLADPERLAEDIPASHKWHHLKKKIRISDMETLNAAMPFVEAAYRTQR